jgi:hypothetical protein
MVALTIAAPVGVGIRSNPSTVLVVGFNHGSGLAILWTGGILGAHAEGEYRGKKDGGKQQSFHVPSLLGERGRSRNNSMVVQKTDKRATLRLSGIKYYKHAQKDRDRSRQGDVRQTSGADAEYPASAKIRGQGGASEA